MPIWLQGSRRTANYAAAILKSKRQYGGSRTWGCRSMDTSTAIEATDTTCSRMRSVMRCWRARFEHPGATAKEWRDPDRPTATDEESMRKLHITFDGHHYHFAGYRYDRLADACRYAELKQKH